jgi:glycosyltransferase involved in cell wall biosynthesis
MKRTILVAYDLNPTLGSEAGVANIWFRLISKYYFVEVITNKRHQKDIEAAGYSNARFHYIDVDSHGFASLFSTLKAFSCLNAIFVKRAKPVISKLISDEVFSLIHCLSPQGVHSYNDLYRLGVPVLIGPLGGALRFPRGFESMETLRYKLRNAFYAIQSHNIKWRQYFINSSRIIIGTPYVQGILPKKCRGKEVVIYDSVIDPNYFAPVEKEAKDYVQILYSSSLEMNKGCTILLAAYRNLIEDESLRAGTRLVYAGEGSLLEAMRESVREYGLSANVLLLGRRPKEEILEYLNASDIFCAPTLREPGGNAILEAMSCELPVITSDYGGPAYCVTNECGIKLRPAKYDLYVKDLESALRYLCSNESERKRLGKNGRQRVLREYSPEVLEERIVRIYEDVALAGY